jgi:hypothetical protein
VLFLHADPDSTEACVLILIFFVPWVATYPDPLAPNWDTPPTIVPPCWIAKLKEKRTLSKQKKKRIAKKGKGNNKIKRKG